MDIKNINHIENRLSVLENQPLQKIYRMGGTIGIAFGELVEGEVFVKSNDNKFKLGKTMRSKYSIHIESCMRITCGREIMLAKNDLYQPSTKQVNNPNFKWDIYGNNFFDEKSESFFSNELPKCKVKKIKLSKFGDLKIILSNDFCIDIFVDASGNEECWRFFDAGNPDETHLVISGEGIDR